MVCSDWMAGNHHGVEVNTVDDMVELPSLETIERVVMRDFKVLDPETGEVKKEETEYLEFVFVWWIRKILPKVAGDHFWGTKYHHLGPVSYQVYPEDNKERVPPSTEAMAVVAYENCRIRWEAVWKDNKKDPNAPTKKYQKKDQSTHIYKGLYSSGDKGQQPWGGWNIEGRKRFYDLCKQIQKNRTEQKERVTEADNLVVTQIKEEIKDLEATHGIKEPRKKQKMAPAEEDVGDDYDEF